MSNTTQPAPADQGRTVTYQGQQYQLTEAAYDILCSLGEDVAAGAVASQQAVFQALSLDGYDLEPPRTKSARQTLADQIASVLPKIDLDAHTVRVHRNLILELPQPPSYNQLADALAAALSALDTASGSLDPENGELMAFQGPLREGHLILAAAQGDLNNYERYEQVYPRITEQPAE